MFHVSPDDERMPYAVNPSVDLIPGNVLDTVEVKQ